MHDGTKLLWHMDRVMAHFDRGERVAPIHIDMGIAKFCNIRCVFCYGQYQEMKPVFIKKEALLQTIKDAAEIGIRSIAFIGDGEPTMNPALYEALELGYNMGLSLALSTNGVLVDNPFKFKRILESCEWMRFCLSAGTREGYKKIHGKDYFDRVVENIARLVAFKEKNKYPCDIGLQAVFVPTTMKEEMLAESRLAVELGVNYFVIKQCSLPDGGESGMSHFDMAEYDKVDVDEVLRQCEAISTEKTEIIVKWDRIKAKGAKPYEGCPSIPFILEASGNGNFYPCGYMFNEDPRFDEYKFGNVHEVSLKKMFESDRWWEIIRKMRYEFDVHEQCKGCCRQDKANEFCWNYLQRPLGLNFI